MTLSKNKQQLPREKLLRFGVHTLTDVELLAIFLRTGTKNYNVLELAYQLFTEFGSFSQLISASQTECCKHHGLGVVKYCQLQAIVELTQRYLKEKVTQENILASPSQTRHYLATRLAHKEREIFLVLFLDNQNQVISVDEMFVGTYNCVEVHPREIVRQALKYNAAALILAHNHPSGIAEPSEADKQITQYIEQVCDLVDIRIVDHIVIGKGEYVSFAERGWI
ncbi:DNA repair protein RadC [Utexia brackfieldae]|uniref:RadC family protein n=1 Tax=Utexia brackfieldae TaxID=3074108 RepID=UPI00370DA91A